MSELRELIQNQGFCRIQNVFPSQELDCCESIITAMMEKESFFVDLLKSDMSGDGESSQQQLELLRPSLLSASLRKSQVYRQCHSMAKEYFGGAAYYLFDHAIFKMPNSTVITPWHQDQAYLGNDVLIPSLHFWIPFQNTDANNGAMRFIKGSHHKLLKHTLAYQRNSHVLRAVHDLENNSVDMNVQRGDVSVHTNFTLHSTTANHSELVRKAWIIHFGEKSEIYKKFVKVKNIALKRINIFRG